MIPDAAEAIRWAEYHGYEYEVLEVRITSPAPDEILEETPVEASLRTLKEQGLPSDDLVVFLKRAFADYRGAGMWGCTLDR